MELKDIKKDYFDRISVSIGVEMDWLKDYSDFTRSQIDKRDYDFVMGSIHFMRLKNEPSYLRVHYKCDDALSVLESYGGVEGVVSEYYEQVRLLSESGLFDCVGHLDRIKHVFGEMFTGNEPWYLKQIDDTLDVIEDVGICVELNTSGFDHPCKETYPSTDIFEKIRSRDIPITIGSDGHISPVNKGLAEGYQILKNLEYGAVNVFEGRKRKEVNI